MSECTAPLDRRTVQRMSRLISLYVTAPPFMHVRRLGDGRPPLGSILLADVADWPATAEELRSLFLRGDMRARILESFAERRSGLHELFMRFDSPPFYIEQGFHPEALTEYFYQFVSA